METKNKFESLSLFPSDDSTSTDSYIQSEQREFEVLFQSEEEDSIRFRVGKTSFTKIYNPTSNSYVSEINIREFTHEMTTGLVQHLKSCGCDQAVSPLFAHETRILIQGFVSGSINVWMEKEYVIWLSGRRQKKWLHHIKKKLFRYFRQFGRGLIWLHKRRYFFTGVSGDLLIVGDELKILTILPFNGDDEEFKHKVLQDVHKFRLYFLMCISYPLWRDEKCPREYNLPTTNATRYLGLSWEVVQFLKDLQLAANLDSLPADAFLNYPIFYTTSERINFIDRVHTELLYQDMIDSVVSTLNEKMRREKDSWKYVIKDEHVIKLLAHGEFNRTAQLEAYKDGLVLYSASAPSDDKSLFSDLCKLFFNSRRHIDKVALGIEGDEIFLHLEKNIPGGVTKIYANLLVGFRADIVKARTNKILEELARRRIAFLERKDYNLEKEED